VARTHAIHHDDKNNLEKADGVTKVMNVSSLSDFQSEWSKHWTLSFWFPCVLAGPMPSLSPNQKCKCMQSTFKMLLKHSNT